MDHTLAVDRFLENYPNPGISKEHETRSCDIFRSMVSKCNLEFSSDAVDGSVLVLSVLRMTCGTTLVYNPYSSFDTNGWII